MIIVKAKELQDIGYEVQLTDDMIRSKTYYINAALGLLEPLILPKEQGYRLNEEELPAVFKELSDMCGHIEEVGKYPMTEDDIRVIHAFALNRSLEPSISSKIAISDIVAEMVRSFLTDNRTFITSRCMIKSQHVHVEGGEHRTYFTMLEPPLNGYEFSAMKDWDFTVPATMDRIATDPEFALLFTALKMFVFNTRVKLETPDRYDYSWCSPERDVVLSREDYLYFKERGLK